MVVPLAGPGLALFIAQGAAYTTLRPRLRPIGRSQGSAVVRHVMTAKEAPAALSKYQAAEEEESPELETSPFSVDDIPQVWYEKVGVELDLFMMAWIPPITAFVTYPIVASGASHIVAKFVNWQSVDGGAFAITLLRPTIGGVVVPTVSIALGTLLATTISVLRDRQVNIRSSINKEACELRLLRSAILGAYGTAQHAGRRKRALSHVRAYTGSVILESSYGGFKVIEKTQLRGGVAVNDLERLQRSLHGIDGVAASRSHSVETCTSLIASLNGHRSDRIAQLLGGFPLLHWLLITQLALSIIIAFLMESNQDVLQFLNSVQLRTCFALIIAVMSGTAALCVDLADPFRGGYSIRNAVVQLVDLDVTFARDIADAEASIASSAIQPSGYTQQKKVPARGAQDWDTRETVYFHLLNSAAGSQIRMVGDVGAWISRRARKLRNLRLVRPRRGDPSKGTDIVIAPADAPPIDVQQTTPSESRKKAFLFSTPPPPPPL